MVIFPAFVHSDSSIIIKINKLRYYLLDRGMLYLYSLFIAGYFLWPMAAGHRRLYYILVFPAALLLVRELGSFYRGNLLAGLLLLYAGWMMSTIAWGSDFSLAGAGWAIWYAAVVLSFVFVSGYLWVDQAPRMKLALNRGIYLAVIWALVSIVVWYLGNPFPGSRLEPLGVMHHPNKSACAYGLFLLLCAHRLVNLQIPRERSIYLACALVLLSLVLFTQSRTALGAVSVGLVVIFGYRALAVVLVSVAASFLLVAGNPDEWWARVVSISFRPGIWEQVLNDMNGHWLFGRGYLLDTHVNAYGDIFSHAHNSYLASLRDGGAIGIILLASVLTTALVWAWRILRDTGERLYLALLLFAMTCIFMDFDRLLVQPKELWLFFWFPLAIVMAVYPRRKDPALKLFQVDNSSSAKNPTRA